MSRLIETIILAVVQGLSEFLPISSSGHLALLGHIFRIREIFDLAIFLHFGTLLAVIVLFRREVYFILRGIVRGRIIIDKHSKITDKYLRLFLLILLGSIPAGLAGFFLKDKVEEAFSSMTALGIFWIITAFIFFITKFTRNYAKPINWWRSLIIGLFQALAIFPGLSRSGLTIAGALYLGLDPADVFEFSFLLAIPAMIGANIYDLKNLTVTSDIGSILIGIIISFIIGLIALILLKRLLIKKIFYLFSIYCLFLGIITLLIFNNGSLK
ncbi:MAG: undecaprenyl-diphosphate phosphatase [candidate division WOR-3 bacterium]